MSDTKTQVDTYFAIHAIHMPNTARFWKAVRLLGMNDAEIETEAQRYADRVTARRK